MWTEINVIEFHLSSILGGNSFKHFCIWHTWFCICSQVLLGLWAILGGNNSKVLLGGMRCHSIFFFGHNPLLHLPNGEIGAWFWASGWRCSKQQRESRFGSVGDFFVFWEDFAMLYIFFYIYLCTVVQKNKKERKYCMQRILAMALMQYRFWCVRWTTRGWEIGPFGFCNALINSDALTVYYSVKQSQFTKPTPEPSR